MLDSIDATFLEDVHTGLSATPKRLPCKYFYDERGSQLFDQICELDEYYLTRTELWIMSRFAREMAASLGKRVTMVELGSGSSIKTRLLLDALEDPAAYVPVDISSEHLQVTVNDLQTRYPDLEILPVAADFTHPFRIPRPEKQASHQVVYFPGSTIGNFPRDRAVELLQSIGEMTGAHGGLLIGIDLIKEVSVLEAAYNDSQGVTAAFNLNVLHRINRELGGNFNVDNFRHHAEFNPDLGRIEIYLASRCRQQVRVGENLYDFAADETICTEYSHKYTVEGFQELASHAGLDLRNVWTDPDRAFAVLYLEQ